MNKYYPSKWVLIVKSCFAKYTIYDLIPIVIISFVIISFVIMYNNENNKLIKEKMKIEINGQIIESDEIKIHHMNAVFEITDSGTPRTIEIKKYGEGEINVSSIGKYNKKIKIK